MYNPTSPIKLRIKEYCKATRNTPAGMEKACGFSNGYFNSLSGFPRREKLNALQDKFPDLSINWLLTGDGEMLNSIITPSYARETDYFAPLVPYTDNDRSLKSLSESGGDFKMLASPVKGADWIMPVIGDRMAPEYPNGSLVAIKRLGDFGRIEWGNIYVIDTSSGPIVRKVNRCRNPQFVECAHLNGKYDSFILDKSLILGIYRIMICMIFK